MHFQCEGSAAIEVKDREAAWLSPRAGPAWYLQRTSSVHLPPPSSLWSRPRTCRLSGVKGLQAGLCFPSHHGLFPAQQPERPAYRTSHTGLLPCSKRPAAPISLQADTLVRLCPLRPQPLLQPLGIFIPTAPSAWHTPTCCSKAFFPQQVLSHHLNLNRSPCPSPVYAPAFPIPLSSRTLCYFLIFSTLLITTVKNVPLS